MSHISDDDNSHHLGIAPAAALNFSEPNVSQGVEGYRPSDEPGNPEMELTETYPLTAGQQSHPSTFDPSPAYEKMETTYACQEEEVVSGHMNQEADEDLDEDAHLDQEPDRGGMEEEIEEGEEEDVDEEDFPSEEEEDFEDSNDKNEAAKSDSNEEKKSEAETMSGLLSLYSGMNDIISENSSISSSTSTPVTPTKTPLGSAPSRLQAALTSSLSYKSSGGGLLVHHPVTPKKRVVNKSNTDHLSEELCLGYRILMELMSDYQKGSNAPFMEPIEMDKEKNGDYLEVVEKPMWLKKIKEHLLDGKYSSVTELIGDLRTMLENAYRYYGPSHSISKKGLRLEHMMEQKIALLPKEVRELCTLEKTSGTPPEDITQKHRNKTARISVNGDNFFSYVLYRVRGCRVNRDKEMKKRRMEAMRQAKRDREQEIIVWEEKLLEPPINRHMLSMWELPQIGHFIFLTLRTLNIYEVAQYELERMLLMPQASQTLAMLLTSLLSSPQQRQKLNEKPYMPYKVWARKLAHKTLLWYRCYSRENQDPQKVFDQMGIEPEFWLICGPSNPFDRHFFHEMTFHQRVWLLKSLCDYLMHNHKTVQEVISEQPETDQREYNLGRDRNGNEYLHFPQFCGQSLRIYRRARVPPPEVPFQEEDANSGTVLPFEKVKEFRKMIKKFRNKYEEEAEWEGARGKKKKRRRRANRSVDPEEEVPVVNRSRPGNLRQRPRARYNDQYEDLGLSSDEEPKSKPKKKHKTVECSSDDDCDENELPAENDEDGVDTPTAPPPNEADDETTNSSMPSTPQENVNRAQQRNPRIRKGGKKKPTCELCGKAFTSIAALKGHRAVHTKEKQKLASEEEANKKSKDDLTSGEPETSVGCVEESAETVQSQNGECDSSDKSEIDAKSNGDKSKEEEEEGGESDSKSENGILKKDLKNESPINGVIKEEPSDVQEKSKKDLIDQGNNVLLGTSEIKEESVDIKEEKVDSESDSNLGIKEEKCNGELDIKKMEFEEKPKLEKVEPTESEKDNTLSCNGVGEQDNEEGKAKSKESSPIPTAESTPVYDPSPYLPRIEDFELVVTSVEQLRFLIKRFGDLPEGQATSTNEEEKSKEDAKPAEKRPSCEVKLHRALCNLLTELLPWETKLLTATKKMRTKLRNEWNDFIKRGEDYVDPAEEAWMSDPEPEPEPPAATPQPSSSSSSSSEESLDEEGNPKRKLRKRRAKRQAATHVMENVPPPIEPPITPAPQKPDSYAVSSRGRVRKVKKIINYDGLDFEKLAMQASLEAEEEKVRRKRKREEEEKEKEEEDKSNFVSYGGVKRYILSQQGHITSFIDNEGQVRSASAIKDNRVVEKKRVDISSVRNLAGQLVTSAKKDSPKPVVRPISSIPDKVFQNANIKPDVPSVVVAAYNDQGSPVYVRVVGEQALQLVKYMKPGTKGPVTQIKLQHHGQTYTVNTNAQMRTQNIPGIPNGERSIRPPAPSVIRSTASPSAVTTSTLLNKPVTGLAALVPTTSPAAPKVAPISSTVGTAAPTSPPNTVALAYRGVARPSRPVTMASGIVRPQGSLIRGILQTDQNRPYAAPTRLVTASPSVVSSVMPPAARPSVSVASPVHVNQVTRPTTSTALTSPVRLTSSQVVNRISGVPTARAVQATVTNAASQSASPVVREQVISQQVPTSQVATVISQPQGQAITAATVVVPASGGQPQLKLESESLAQLMQRTGSKIVAMPNGRGGYTLSLTPGAVPPGQKAQSPIASSTASKVQVVTSTPASLLQDSSPTSSPPSVQPQVIQQQSLPSPSVARPTTVVQGVQSVSRPAGVTQQVGLKQVIPVNQTAMSGSVIKANNVTQGTQLVLNSGHQNLARVQGQPRVYSNLVAAQATQQQSRNPNVSVATVLSPQQNVNSVVSSNQQSGVLQHAVVHKSNTVQQQSQAVGQQQYVVQQRVVAQPGGTHQVVRLANPSQAGTAGQRLTVQIVQQAGGGQQVVQMVPQVVSQASATSGQQSLIYVQGTGQVIAQQPKASLTAAAHQTQPQSQTQPRVAQQQVVQVAQPQQQVVHVPTSQHQVVQAQQQQQVVQVAQQHMVQVAQPQQQHVVQVTQPQQQQQVVQVAQHQQQQVVQVAQQQQQQVVQVAQQQQHQQQIVQVAQQQHQQQQIVQVAQPQQQQVVQVAQPQQQHIVQVAQPQQQQQQHVVKVAQPQQQQVVQVAQSQQQQVVQVAAQPQQQQQQQTTQGRLVLVRTQQGEQMALHHSDGRLTFLTQEQLQAALRNNAVHHQPASS